MHTRRDLLALGAVASASLVFGAAPVAAHGASHKKGTAHPKGGAHHVEGKEVTLTGEVVDIVCYLQHPESGRGDDHAACAKQCINKGLAAGLLSEGKLYLLMRSGHDPIVDEITPFIAKKVKMTGVVLERGGFPALVFSKIQRA